MASRIYCDGCDRELPTIHGRGRVAVAKPHAEMQSADYDLCEACCEIFFACFNPQLWPRTIKEPA